MQLDREATAARRQASRLAGLVRLPAAWPMAFRNPPARGKSDRHPLRRKRNPCKGCVCPTPTAGEQSGDRQRREKGPPILTAEKGEHERAPNVSDSYPTPLRATLRTPSFKNGQYRAFSRRVSVANCPEGKRGPSGALGAAQSDPQGGWEASRATGRELCDTGHPVLEDSP